MFVHLSSRELLKEQDDSLDVLGQSISRMGEMALGIKSEIETQNKYDGVVLALFFLLLTNLVLKDDWRS